MREESQKKPATAKIVALVGLCLVLLVLFLKVSFINVHYSTSRTYDSGSRKLYVIWNTKDTASRFKTFDSVNAACARDEDQSKTEEEKDWYYERVCYPLLKGYVEKAPYIFSIG